MTKALAHRTYQAARIALGRARSARQPWKGVRILGYHRVAEFEHALAVRPAEFRWQMEQVAAGNAQVIRLDEAVRMLEQPVDGRYVAVTFDDGYRDFLDHALPVLRELGIPATMFVPTAIIDGEASYYWFAEPPPALTWDEIASLVDEGVDVQPHTRTHPWLPRVDEARARDEIAGSKQALESHVPYEATTFCYPAGLYGERELRLVREAGYRAALTTDPGANPGGRPLDRLRRTLVFWGDSRPAFEAKLAGHLDRPSLPWLLVQKRRARGGLRRTEADS